MPGPLSAPASRCNCPLRELTPEAVTVAVERLLRDDTIRTNAKRIQEEIATMPSAAAVLETIVASKRIATPVG